MIIPTLQRTILCQICLLSICAGIAWIGFGDRTIERPQPDMRVYLALYDGASLREIPAPFRYRVWTPWLAARVPAPAEERFDGGRDTAALRAHFRFALLNALGLFFAAVGLSRLTSRFVAGRWVGFGSALLFLFSYYPVAWATRPMVEAWSYAFLVWALVFLIERRQLALALTFTLGLTCKETILLVLPAALLLRVPLQDRLRRTGLLVPGLIAYLAWRTVGLPADEPLYSAASTQAWLHALFVTGEQLWGNAARALFAFHLLWIPALWSWWRRRGEDWLPIRWGWIVPGILITPILFALVPGRVWFFAFPFVMPPAVDGIATWIDRSRRRG